MDQYSKIGLTKELQDNDFKKADYLQSRIILCIEIREV